MQQRLLFLFFFVLAVSSKDADNENLRIVRPLNYKVKPDADKVLSDMEDEKVIPKNQGQLEYVEMVADNEDDSSSESENEGEEMDSKSIKKLVDNLARVLSDYADYDDYESPAEPKQVSERRDSAGEEMKRIESISPAEFIAQQKPIPRLAIDPPRKPLPDFSLTKDEESETINNDVVIPVVVKESNSEKESILIPWNISISIDISHLLLIGMAFLLLFWIIQKAFNMYARPRSIIISPKQPEEGSVHKVPLE